MVRTTAYCLMLAALCGCGQKPAKQVNNTIQPAASIPTGAVNTFDVDDNAYYCNYDGQSTQKQFFTFASKTEAADMVSLILKQVGLPSNFEVMASNVPNATAFMYTTGNNRKRYIFYSARFFMAVEDSTKTDWGKVSILAHEIGHHLAGHTLTKEKRAGTELEADKFSGFILRRLGASKEESIAAIEKMGSEKGSESHPDKRTRADAILAGWEEADFQQPVIAARKRGITQALDMPEPLPEVKGEKPRGPKQADTTQPSPWQAPQQGKPQTQEVDFDPFYIVPVGTTKNRKQAADMLQDLEKQGYKGNYLWGPDYHSLPQQEYVVYIGPFTSQFNCELAVERYREKSPEAYGLLVSAKKNNVRINGLGKVEK